MLKHNERYAYLDAIRGIAILLVVMVHATSGVNLSNTIFDSIAHSGNRGVQLFFILSGYTLFMHYKKTIDAHETYSWINFYIRRLFRIWPLWCLMIPVYILFKYPVSATDVVGTLFFVSGFFPDHLILIEGGWSIFVEVVFYILFPVVVLWSKDVRISLIFLCITVALSFIWQNQFFLNNPLIDEKLIYEFPLRHLFCFILGINLFHLKEYLGGYTLTFNKATSAFLAVCAISVIALLLPQGVIIASFGFCILFCVIFLEKGALFCFLNRNRTLIAFGQCSYGVYITHFLVIKMIRFFDVRGIPMIPPFLENMGWEKDIYMILYILEISVVSFIISWPIYKYYELFFIKKAKDICRLRNLKGRG